MDYKITGERITDMRKRMMKIGKEMMKKGDSIIVVGGRS